VDQDGGIVRQTSQETGSGRPLSDDALERAGKRMDLTLHISIQAAAHERLANFRGRTTDRTLIHMPNVTTNWLHLTGASSHTLI